MSNSKLAPSGERGRIKIILSHQVVPLSFLKCYSLLPIYLCMVHFYKWFNVFVSLDFNSEYLPLNKKSIFGGASYRQ